MAKFRKSKTVGGVKFNFSKSGVGFSVGTKGARIGKGADGNIYSSVGAAGVYERKNLTSKSKNETSEQDQQTLEPTKQDVNAATVFLMAGVVDFFVIFGWFMGIFSNAFKIACWVIVALALIGISASRKKIFSESSSKSKVAIWILRILALATFAAGFYKSGFFLLPAVFLFFSFL